MKSLLFVTLSTTCLLAAATARAEDLQTYNLTIKGHRFVPNEVTVPAGKPFMLEVANQDDTADEFEMNSPPLEKIVTPGATGSLRVRPLAPGRFVFFDDFHPDVAKGAIVAK